MSIDLSGKRKARFTFIVNHFSDKSAGLIVNFYNAYNLSATIIVKQIQLLQHQTFVDPILQTSIIV